MPGYSVSSLKFSVADLKADDLKKAADMRFKDYEDAIQSACATRIKANYIVTRNMKDFSESKVTAIKPAELLDRIWRISTDEGQSFGFVLFSCLFYPAMRIPVVNTQRG